MSFTFKLVEPHSAVGKAPGAYLFPEQWDDFGFQTLFELKIRITQGSQLVKIGRLRIAHPGMQSDDLPGIFSTREQLDETFDRLPQGYFSLGVDDSYYSNINELPNEIRHNLYRGLNDLAFNTHLWRRVRDAPVLQQSVMRGIENPEAEIDRLAKIAYGRARTVQYEWTFEAKPIGASNSINLRFKVDPHSDPPSNVYALIGRNGAGKTRILHQLASKVSRSAATISDLSDDTAEPMNVVAVSFSAFDTLFASDTRTSTLLPFKYVGLHASGKRGTFLKPEADQKREFLESFEICMIGTRRQLWLQAMHTLNYAGSGFLEGREDLLLRVSEGEPINEVAAEAEELLEELSSGHRMVYQTMTHLVASVTERTLVLIDEPETHLHPPLLSALVKSISDLLRNRNGMALLATHSPVVLQEIPRKCVFVLRRHGRRLRADPPEIETWGENVGDLTRSVFHLEVTATGYYRRLAEMVDSGASYEEIIDRFNSIGTEARALLRALIAERRSELEG
ncbi:AAA family ATPase [Streptomyces sp. TRM75563]|uniref:AAA family ATPase n=1 Tax=Streptomyces sp. TRM75563 TaxID=2817418 RepID=UPI001F61DE93|nr:AAA family ATPase [Streptomyces sp. TRM75563]MCI4041782.1 ATP-binding protein [Streptomyces sp. TRM75563]